MRLVTLASSSPRRTVLLEQIGVAHRVLAPEVDETVAPGLRPDEVVRILAARKSDAAWRLGADGLVVGADTVVALGRRLFGKPADEEQAREMLRALRGRVHHVFTGVCVLSAASGERRIGVAKVRVKFCPVADAEIDLYAASGEALDKAGAYSVQGSGARFVEWVCGDYYAVVGLPLAMTHRFLKELGYEEPFICREG